MSEARSAYPLNNILLITDLYPIDDKDTIPMAIENFVLALIDFNINVTVLRPNFIFNTVLRKHKVYKQGIYNRNGIKIYNRNFILPFIFNKFIPEEKYDLIISHMPSGNIFADLINKKLNLARISIIHNSDYKVLNDFKYSFYFKNRLKKALKNSNLIGARNSNLSEKLKTDFILPSFIDKKYIIKDKKPSEKLKIITLSRLIKRKNIDMIITALKNLKKDFEYNIFGSGKEENKLKKLIKKYNLENKIKIHKPIEHNAIWEKLDNADIFILPSEEETFGLCYLEAMARGLITIAKKSESMDNIITSEKNGFLIENSKDITNILENLNQEKKQEIMENTLENIKNYEKEKIISKYIETMKSCLPIFK